MRPAVLVVEPVVVRQRRGEVGRRGGGRRAVGALVALVGLGARLALDLAVGGRDDGRHDVARRHVLAWDVEGYF